jgi:hypothetical protein
MGDQYEDGKMSRPRKREFGRCDLTMHHFAGASGETAIQIHGTPVFALRYVNPGDDPSKTKLSIA